MKNRWFLAGFGLALGVMGLVVGLALLLETNRASAEKAQAPEAGHEGARPGLDPRNMTDRFLVEIDGIVTSNFWSIQGLRSETDVVPFTDGLGIERLTAGQAHHAPDGLVMTRVWDGTSDLQDWYETVLDGSFVRKTMSVRLLDQGGNEVARYNFFEVWPSSWGLSDLGTAQELGCANCPERMLHETIVVQVEDFERS